MKLFTSPTDNQNTLARRKPIIYSERQQHRGQEEEKISRTEKGGEKNSVVLY
jgi:hypothetical protein